MIGLLLSRPRAMRPLHRVVAMRVRRTGDHGHILCVTVCDNSHMATSVAIEPELLDKALALGGKKTRTQAVTLALFSGAKAHGAHAKPTTRTKRH